MKSKLLSLTLFLLTAIAAKAANVLTINGNDYTLGSTSFLVGSQASVGITSGSIEWKADEKMLVMNDLQLKTSSASAIVIKGDANFTAKVKLNGSNLVQSIGYTGQNVERYGMKSNVNIEFFGDGYLDLRGWSNYGPGSLKMETSHSTVTVKKAWVCAERGIEGASDKSTVIRVEDGGSLDIAHYSVYTLANIAEIQYGSGIGMKLPHGAYIGTDGKLRKADGSYVTLNMVKIGSVADYGFSICGYEINESNYDLFDKWGIYFPNIKLEKGSINFNWKENTVYLNEVTIGNGAATPSILNRNNAGLKLNVKGYNSIKHMRLQANLEVNGPGMLDMGTSTITVDKYRKLTVLTDVKARNIAGYATTVDNEKSSLCIEDKDGTSRGKIVLTNGTSNTDPYTLSNIRLVDHWGKEGKTPLSTTEGDLSSPVYVHNAGGKSGAFAGNDRSDFCKGAVTLDGNATIYPIEINGRYVTSANRANILVPEVSYSNASTKLTYWPSVDQLNLSRIALNSLPTGNTPVIKHTRDNSQLVIVEDSGSPVGSSINCSAKCPAVESSCSLGFGTVASSTTGQIVITRDNDDWHCGMIDVADGGTNHLLQFVNLRSMKTQYVHAPKLVVRNSSVEIADMGSTNYNPLTDEYSISCELENVGIDTNYGWAYYDVTSSAPNKYLKMNHDQKVKFSRTAPTEYDVRVGGQQVTSLNKDNIAFPGLISGKVTYVPEESTLLLDHVNIENKTNSPTFQFEQGDFTLNAVGKNKIIDYGNEVNMLLVQSNVTTTGAVLNMVGSDDGNGGIYLFGTSSLTVNTTDEQSKSSVFEFVDGSNPNSTTKLIINKPVQFKGASNESKRTISVSELSVNGMEVKSPYSISGGTVVDENNQPTDMPIEFVVEGTNPIYPSSITVNTSTPTLTKKGSQAVLTADIAPTNVTDNTLVWLTSNEEVATVDGEGRVTAVANGVATITARGVKGAEGSIDITVAIPDPDVITLDNTSIWFSREDMGDEYIHATVGPDDCDKTIEWTSSNEDVITLTKYDSYVRVTRVADEGTATITAKTVNGLEAQCEVRVHYPIYAQEVTLSEKSVRLTAVGQEQKVKATVGPADTESDLLGFWLDTFGDTEVADVDMAADGTLTITAKKKGNMGVAVHATCNGEVTGAYDYVGILVKPVVTATGLQLSMDDNKFYEYGQSRTISAIFTPADADNRELAWSSNDKTVVTVDESGLVTSVGEGTATITAKTTDGTNLEAKQVIEVMNPSDWTIIPADGIALSRQELTLFPNQRFEMEATLLPVSANTYVKWEVEEVSGDGGRVEVYYDEDAPKASRTAELSAYVMNPADATYPIVAKVKATALGAANEPLASATCTVTIVNDIYFTAANEDGININYHVVKADPQDMQVELYGKETVKYVNGSYSNVLEPAVASETTGKLTVPSQVTYDGQTYWVTTLGKSALAKTKIEELVLPEGFTTVKAYAVNGGYEGYGTTLKSVTLPSTLKYIGNGAFQSQTALKNVYLDLKTAPMGLSEDLNEASTPDEAFNGIAADATLHVPYDCLENYAQMPWTDWFATIDDGSYLTVTTEEGVAMSLHISSETDLTAEVKGKPVNMMMPEVTKAVASGTTAVTIPAQADKYRVTSISERAFAETTESHSLTTVVIPESIETIGASAFADCTLLKEVTIYRATPPAESASFEATDQTVYQQRTLKVPFGCKEAYDIYPWNNVFGNIVEMEEEGYVPDTDTSGAENVIYTANMEVSAGQKTAVSIRMKNNVAIRAFQFKLFLPDGVEAVKNAKSKYIATLNRERLAEDDEHTLSSAKQKDGSILFLCGSLYDENFAAGDGEIISVPVQIASDLADGNYPLTIQQTIMTETDITKYYETNLVKSTIIVGEGGEDDYIKGDVDDNGAVNVLDYTGIANHILGDTPDGFNEKAADVDDNGVVNVLDYTGVANIILGLDGAANARAMFRATDLSSVDNVIYLSDLTIKDADKTDYLGQEFLLTFRLKSARPIRGFQFDLYLPEGLEAVKTKKGKYTAEFVETLLPEDDEHTLSVAGQSDGAVRFLCSSLYDESFDTGDDDLFTLKVKMADDIADGSYTIQLKDVLLTETDIKKYYETPLVEAKLTIGDAVGITTQRADALTTGGQYYNLKGQRVDKPTKGIYLRDGRKVVVK